jgi:putative nucleotidyltransferase with HDIG domain
VQALNIDIIQIPEIRLRSRGHHSLRTEVAETMWPRREAPTIGESEAHTTEHDQLLLYAADLQEAYRRERERTVAVEQATLDLVHSLVHVVEARDPGTVAHTLRVAHYARRMGEVLGWSAARVAILEVGAWLHDIGKIGISDSILRKPGPLTADEYTEMKTHVAIGLRILSGIESLAGALLYVAYHHERYDGTGYPFGLAGTAIPLEGRLLAVIDAFDAMTSDRPYREACSQDAALTEILRHRGTQFDPEMVAAFQVAYAAGWGVIPGKDEGPLCRGPSSFTKVACSLL